jgi:hypothetical protein
LFSFRQTAEIKRTSTNTMLLSKSICAISLLALSFLFSKAQGVPDADGKKIIGYRTVSKVSSVSLDLYVVA